MLMICSDAILAKDRWPGIVWRRSEPEEVAFVRPMLTSPDDGPRFGHVARYGLSPIYCRHSKRVRLRCNRWQAAASGFAGQISHRSIDTPSVAVATKAPSGLMATASMARLFSPHL